MSVKESTEDASTTLSGKLFQVSTTLLLNTFLRIFNIDLHLNKLYLQPLVLVSVMIVNNLSLSTILISLTVL